MTELTPVSEDLPELPEGLRLVAVDMDGTLLDEHKRIPDGLWSLLQRLRAAGVMLAPASGRQYASLARDFADSSGALPSGMAFIAENGAYVVRDGVEVSASPLPAGLASVLVRRARELSAHHDLGVVVCGVASAYVERADRAFLDQVEPYYAALQVVQDLDEVSEGDDPVIKIAVNHAESSELLAPEFADLIGEAPLVISGQRWLDVMAPGVSKGRALRALQADLGVSAAQTVAFGDYLNDIELLAAAGTAYAMANAHPQLLAQADFVAPANTDHGVLRTLEELLARGW